MIKLKLTVDNQTSLKYQNTGLAQIPTVHVLSVRVFLSQCEGL